MPRDSPASPCLARWRTPPRSEQFLKIFHTNPDDIDIEVEVETTDQLREALARGVKRIMLDNRSTAALAEMVKFVRAQPRGAEFKLEASGNVTLANIREIAQTGVDYISIGSLTHSAPGSDFSLKLITHD